MLNQQLAESTTDRFIDALFPGRKVLNVFEVSQALKVSPRHVFDLIEEGNLEAMDVGGGLRHHWRITLTELKRFLNKRSSLRAL